MRGMAALSGTAHERPAGNSGSISGPSGSAAGGTAGVSAGVGIEEMLLGAGSGPAMAAIAVAAGRPDPSRFPVAAGRSRALQALRRLGHYIWGRNAEQALPMVCDPVYFRG